MRYKAVIFDLDGTLLDTLEDLANSANRILAAAGLPVHPVASYRYFVGDGLQVLIERIVPAEKKEAGGLAALADAFLEDYGRNWRVRSRPYDGIPALLTALQAAGVAMNVLSNKPHDFTMLCVNELLGEWSFQEIQGQQPGRARKPDPAGALHIAKKLRLAPADILYLGDTATDMRTALAAGMYPVGALWGFRTAEELLANGAAALLSKPADLLSLVPIAG